jgi:pimeloyl-ACP methyl ester carboxylesterase
VIRATVLVGCLALATACGAPFAVKRNLIGAQREAAGNVIVTGELSRRTRNILYEHDLVTRFDEDPTGALAQLHAELLAGQLSPRQTGALAELAYHHAMYGGGRPYYLAAALYAWEFLFPEEPRDRPDLLDAFVRLTNEIYNRGLAQGFAIDDKMDLRSGSYPLPFGTLEVDLDAASLQWSGHQLHDFFPLTDIEVTGFPTYYRWPGIGAPLAAKVTPNPKDVSLLGPRIRVPVTAVLQPRNLLAQLRDGTVHATLTAYAGYGDTTIEIDGRKVPLAAEPTATLGLGLSETKIWTQELSIFLGGTGIINRPNRLVSTRPYRRGLIPVVLVHGTGSSAIRWAELYNELDNDPIIHDHYQFWFFSYDSGNPIIYSSSILREALEEAVAKLDPEGEDPALRRMVVMGHSQGGLLTKMTVVESGDAFWKNASSKPFDEVKMSPETRDLLRRVAFVHPLPFVTRVVFVATPHHGSYIAGNWLAHQFARLISMPLNVTKVLTDIATLNRESQALRNTGGSPTAVDNMTPGNPFVKTLATLPIAPGVVANSIIPVDGDPPYPGKNDGVVEYNSAHIDGVESEVVVHSVHSCQSNPHTMAEVRRILLKHLNTP